MCLTETSYISIESHAALKRAFFLCFATAPRSVRPTQAAHRPDKISIPAHHIRRTRRGQPELDDEGENTGTVCWRGAARHGRQSSRSSLASETVQGAALTLQSVDHVHRGDGLPLGVLGVGDGVADDVL